MTCELPRSEVPQALFTHVVTMHSLPVAGHSDAVSHSTQVFFVHTLLLQSRGATHP
jgi:hypothetical protein